MTGPRRHAAPALALVSLAAIVFVPSGLQGSPGTWSATASMANARQLHTATRLSDGRVLVTGGVTTGGGATATAELYDPSTGTWSSAASMHVVRSRHVAVLLNNGRVLVAGGRVANDVRTASTEIYDPSSDTWALTSPMSVGRDSFTGTLLADGRALVSGGVGGDGSGARVEKSGEIYDPSLGQWTPAGNMTKRKFNHAAVRLNDGRVLVVGGASEAGDCIYSTTAEIFSPATGDWQATDPMATPRGLPAVALLPTGDVLVAGGLTLPATCNPATASAELYDTSSMRWSTTTEMATARRGFGDAQLNDGRVLIAGGRPPAGEPLSSAELYNLASETWGAAGAMMTARIAPRLTLLADGRVLATGGALASGPLASAELFTP